MNRFLLKNDTTENVSARVSISPSDELGNLGHEGATVIEDGRLTTCLAPTAVALPDPTGHRSQCFELKDEGRYAIEINGVIQPYAFSPVDLLDCFNGEHESQIRFLECSENVCLNAIETASTGAVWGDATITINGIIYPSIYAPGVDLAVKLILDGELHFIWNNKTTEFQRVEINNATLNSGDYGWGDNTNPTMKYDIENGTIKFCLAPAEAEFRLVPIPEETVTVNKPFLEYKNNPTFSSLFSKMSMEYNGKIYTSYHLNSDSNIRSPLLAMLQGEWTAADGEVIKPIGTHVEYEDVYSVPRHFKLVDDPNTDNIYISGFEDNTLLPNLTFTEDPATMKFIVTPSSGIAPPPEQPEREWVDLIDVYGAGRGSVGDIHFDIEMKTMGYCKKIKVNGE